MINRHPSTSFKLQPKMVAAFGRSLLVRIAPSKYELHGASDEDLTSAKEWISLFMHEALLSGRPDPLGKRRSTPPRAGCR